ncbi:type II toxin-antitoxin system MqsR family toxin [Paenalkalicoccus suaedae]|uniref:Type II toxin-antitoxin system MqsR family toxin n=1 Tax=Paenalkalicoccus suaedae TaxID=2592382 RepID=A0A859FJ80_9BACI|nr:type II toxin-antitoxin system MqsR family toxin [Paenalkalicoccus suaedae]QKS72555.1 type II toxin-antitoxin system MqsR family toxin [Paenalkalicoccus suaedae]
MHSSSIQEVNAFLKEMRKVIMLPRQFRMEPRTFDGLAALGLTIPQAKKEIQTLKFVHYDRGPTPDKIGDDTSIWEFGKPIDDDIVYIKLKLHPKRGCICLSFKPSTGPFTLPYRNL